MKDERTVHAVVRNIDERLREMDVCRIQGEAFDVHCHREGTFSFTLVGSSCDQLALDDLDGISAYTTSRTTIDPKARTRLQTLDRASWRSEIDKCS